jgi:large subunit ribosomal protein L31
MKDGIHPNYQEATMVCLSCGSEVQTRSTQPTIRLDICSNCHPFYTGKKRIVDTAGRVDRFNQRRVAGEKAQKAAAKREKAKAGA